MNLKKYKGSYILHVSSFDRYLDGPIHMPSSLEHLEDMCDIDDPFENVTETLRNETKSVVHDIIDIVKKAEDEGREMKEPKGKTINLKWHYAPLSFNSTFVCSKWKVSV